MYECVCYCAYFYYVNKLYVHVCVLERAKHSFFALPNPLSCSVMNKICLNQGPGYLYVSSYCVPVKFESIMLRQVITTHRM